MPDCASSCGTADDQGSLSGKNKLSTKDKGEWRGEARVEAKVVTAALLADSVIVKLENV
jgi:hypothetical protein